MEIRETKDNPRNEGPLPRFGLFGDYWTLEEAVAAMRQAEAAMMVKVPA